MLLASESWICLLTFISMERSVSQISWTLALSLIISASVHFAKCCLLVGQPPPTRTVQLNWESKHTHISLGIDCCTVHVDFCGTLFPVLSLYCYTTRGGQRPIGNSKSQKCDGCPIKSHFIGLGLLRTVFEIVVACREGPVPEFCCIAGDIEGGISENSFRPITFDWSVLRT